MANPIDLDDDALSLWYRQPAEQWTDALPLGNGRLGAMVFGGVASERLQLNEDTLWGGGPYNPINPAAREALPKVRQLILAGEYKAASDLVAGSVLAIPLKQMPYQALGNLHLQFPHDQPSAYRRSLNLDRAVATVAYANAGGTYQRETFISAVDGVLAIRLTADRPGAISFSAGIDSSLPADVSASAGCLVMTGQNGAAEGIDGGLKFEARLQAFPQGGRMVSRHGALVIEAADSVVLFLAAATSYKRFDDAAGDPADTVAVLAAAATKGYDRLLADHVADYQRLFRRVSIDLGSTPAAALPTDQRVAQSAALDDPNLAALYLQYARYMLIACSRPGSQPANLQGIWNDMLSPPWGSKYTININTEMNYWPAEPLNLAECVEPLVAMVEDLAVTGAQTAKEMYNARGWVCHHNTDLWRASAPIDGADYGMWPTGGAWLCRNLYEHYLYGRDRDFLSRIFPLLKGAAAFFLDTLIVESSHGWLVTCPSISPENQHPHGAAVCAGPTMDQQIIRDLFDATIDAATALNSDAPLVVEIEHARARLAPTQVGAQGQIQEWLEDWDAAAPEQQHRHISHLYGLFPSNQIDPQTTPHLAAAAKVTLNARGDHTTGWAIAWRINCWARLLDGERAYSILRLLLDPSRTYLNLFDAHPPFQIDGNFGGASGIVELLLQSHNGELHLLPALPKAWPSGRVTGLRARGGFEVDLEWRDGRLTAASVRSARDSRCAVRYQGAVRAFEMCAGAAVSFSEDLNAKM